LGKSGFSTWQNIGISGFCIFGMFLAFDSVGTKRNSVGAVLKEKINPMRLFFYSSRDDQNKMRLEAAICKVIPENQIERFKGLDDFLERLRMPVEPDSIAVLSAWDLEELQQMQLLRGLLPEIFVILVIPDRKKGTIRLAHLLLPRFLSQINDNFLNLSKVLDKMYRTAH
jgi:hypothetical protein